MQGLMRESVKMLIGVAVPLAAFATGLRAANVSPLWLLRRPRLLFMSLLAILVVVPTGAVLFLMAVQAPLLVRAGITMAVMAIGIGPPAAFQRTRAREQS